MADQAVQRYQTTPEFSKTGVVYCLRLAPIAFWVERPGGIRVETYCCLEAGHPGDHRWALRWRGQEPGQKEGGVESDAERQRTPEP